MESLVGQRLHLLGGGRPPIGGRGREVRGVVAVPLDDVVGVLLLALAQRVVPLELALPILPIILRRLLRLPSGGDLGVRLLLVLVDEAAAPQLAAAPGVRGRRRLLLRLRLHGEFVLGRWRRRRRRDVVVLKEERCNALIGVA